MGRKIAWVTGGSRGIGRATCQRLSADGYDIAIGFHTKRTAATEVKRAVEANRAKALLVQADMGDPDAARDAHAEIVDTLGRVDALVVSHGIYDRAPIHKVDDDAWRKTLRVNLDGAFYATQAVLPAMRKARWGRIVYLGSVLGRVGSGHGAHYSASKAALLGLARSVAKEVGKDGVTVNVLAPGAIDTDIIASDTPERRAKRQQEIPIGRVGTPQECADAIAYLLSDGAGLVTGAEMRLDGGFEMG